MHESLLVLMGVLAGTVFTGAGCFLGAYLVKKTYMEVTNPSPPMYLRVQEDEEQLQKPPESYDWDEYDSYLKPPLDEDGNDPEA